jgi:hypothetical protein
MSLEGLQAVLDKEDIVETQRAVDFLERPEFVDEAYKRHVRTYVPLSRQASQSNGQSVVRFERKVIREIREAGALRGYITAEYGHGKTSTALYLWKRAREENILAVPPFKLLKLADLIVATFGWLRYEIGRTRPELLEKAQALYDDLMHRSAKTLARQYDIEQTKVQQMIRDGSARLDLLPADYIDFFEKMTTISQEAGFEGLLVIADEIQQYIEPEIKSGVKDPISELFDVISAILTRRHHLCFGLIMVIPSKELSVLQDQRGDLVHRALQASLDLSAIYDSDFPKRLWHRLAELFDFEEHLDRILSPECLTALGQISSRDDLADGPRTVVKVFTHATQRYINVGYPNDDPYTPLHLVNDFLSRDIPYVRKIPQVTSQALSHSLVKGNPARARAIKWAAAFPNEGVPRGVQEDLELTRAFDDLAHSTLGDLIISVGDVENRGFTLRGLANVAGTEEWLPSTIREFWRIYHENSDKTCQRTLQAFTKLIVEKIFPENQWKTVEHISGSMVSNAGVVLEGSFRSFHRRFPERLIHVRVLWEDEAIKDAGPKGEVIVQLRLRRHLDWPEEKRREHTAPIEVRHEAHQINLNLNLMHRDPKTISPQLERTVGPVVSPYKLTPLLLLTLYQFLEEKREKQVIPKAEDQLISSSFQPDLLDNAFRELFRAEVGAPVGAAQERIIEVATLDVLESMYPDYDTLIKVSNWRSSLQKYANAVKHLETTHERQGQIVVEGNKAEIATLFTLSNTGLDSFISTFPSLIKVERDFPTRSQATKGEKGAVRFQLHDLEQRVKRWIQENPDTESVKVAGQLHEVHYILSNEVYRRAGKLGYKEQEIDNIVDLMIDRGLVERDTRRGLLRETVAQAPSVDELVSEVNAWEQDIDTLLEAFSNSAQLQEWQSKVDRVQQVADNQLRAKPSDEQLIRYRRSVRTYRQQLANFVEERHKQLIKTADRLVSQLPTTNRRQEKVLKSSIQGGVDYVQQVNDLRVRVQREHTALESKIDQLHHHAETTQAALRSEDLSISALTRLAKELQSHEQKAKDLRQQQQTFNTHFDHFANWVTLVSEGSDLMDDIQKLGDLVNDELSQLRDLSREINGRLSAEKRAALPYATTYEPRIAELKEQVRTKYAEVTNQFNDQQQRYRDILKRELNVPPGQLWDILTYNPVAPAESYHRLLVEVRSVLERFLTQLRKSLLKNDEAVRATLNSPLLGHLPPGEKESIIQPGKTQAEILQGLRGNLKEIEVATQEQATLEDFPTEGKGQFHRLLQKINEVYVELQKVRHAIKALEHRLQDMELTPTEEKLLHTLVADTTTTEVNELQKATTTITEDEFWQALQGLSAKRQIHVTVTRVRYD